MVLSTVGLSTVGLLILGLLTVGLSTVGLPSVGLLTVGLLTVGMSTVGLSPVRLLMRLRNLSSSQWTSILKGAALGQDFMSDLNCNWSLKRSEIP